MATGQEKLSRLLKVISLLKIKRGRTIKSMAEELETSERTIYRYIETLEECGFSIDQSMKGNRWFIVPDGENDGNLINFTLEEASLIKDLVKNNAEKHPLESGILQKLYINSELKPLSKNITNARINALLNKLKGAKNKKKVYLKSYHSLSSNAIKDYLVEPHDFSDDDKTVMAYDINADKNKQFKLCRIGDVIPLGEQTHMNKHQSKPRDAFGFQGDDNEYIEIKLNLASKTLMQDLYKGTKEDEYWNEYTFRGTIHYVEGVGRFLLGQLDNVEIVKGEALKKFIQNKINEFHEKYFEPVEVY